MDRTAIVTILAVAALLLAGLPAAALASPGNDQEAAPGTVRGFRVELADLPPVTGRPSRDSDPLDVFRLPATPTHDDPGVSTGGDEAGAVPVAQEAVRRAEPPPRDKIGGFQFSLLGGVQLVGSASGQGGVVLGYFKPSTAAIGVEAEAGVTLGPNGEVYHGLLSIILQSGARSSKIVPYLAVGGGVFRAEVDLRNAVEEELPNFGIDLPDSEEEGALIAVGLGVRYYLSDWLSLRLDYREFRALTEADGSFLDRLFALRRIGGMLALEF